MFRSNSIRTLNLGGILIVAKGVGEGPLASVPQYPFSVLTETYERVASGARADLRRYRMRTCPPRLSGRDRRPPLSPTGPEVEWVGSGTRTSCPRPLRSASPMRLEPLNCRPHEIPSALRRVDAHDFNWHESECARPARELAPAHLDELGVAASGDVHPSASADSVAGPHDPDSTGGADRLVHG